jgi:hypothetical protein
MSQWSSSEERAWARRLYHTRRRSLACSEPGPLARCVTPLTKGGGRRSQPKNRVAACNYSKQGTEMSQHEMTLSGDKLGRPSRDDSTRDDALSPATNWACAHLQEDKSTRAKREVRKRGGAESSTGGASLVWRRRRLGRGRGWLSQCLIAQSRARAGIGAARSSTKGARRRAGQSAQWESAGSGAHEAAHTGRTGRRARSGTLEA